MTGMKTAQCVLLVLTGAAIVLSGMCLAKEGVLNMDPVGNAATVLLWLTVPVVWLIVGLLAKRESTLGFCLLMSVYYICGMLFFLWKEEKEDVMGAHHFRELFPIVMFMGTPFLVVFESYTRKFVVWLYTLRFASPSPRIDDGESSK